MIRLCLSGTAFCSGCNPCQQCHLAIMSRVMPKAMIAGGFNQDPIVAKAFLEAYMQAFRDLQGGVMGALQQQLAAAAAPPAVVAPSAPPPQPPAVVAVPEVARFGPKGRTGPADCQHSAQDWYVKNDQELGCSECDAAKPQVDVGTPVIPKVGDYSGLQGWVTGRVPGLDGVVEVSLANGQRSAYKLDDLIVRPAGRGGAATAGIAPRMQFADTVSSLADTEAPPAEVIPEMPVSTPVVLVQQAIPPPFVEGLTAPEAKRLTWRVILKCFTCRCAIK